MAAQVPLGPRSIIACGSACSSDLEEAIGVTVRGYAGNPIAQRCPFKVPHVRNQRIFEHVKFDVLALYEISNTIGSTWK